MASQTVSALDHVRSDDAPARITMNGMVIEELAACQKLVLRGHPDPQFIRAIAGCTGSPVPTGPDEPTADDPSCLPLGQTEWLITSTKRTGLVRELAAVVENRHGAVFDASAAWVALRLTGKHITSLLARGSNLDLHPREFPGGTHASTQLARIPILLYRHENVQGFDLYVDRSLAIDLWLWLRDTAKDMAI